MIASRIIGSIPSISRRVPFFVLLIRCHANCAYTRQIIHELFSIQELNIFTMCTIVLDYMKIRFCCYRFFSCVRLFIYISNAYVMPQYTLSVACGLIRLSEVYMLHVFSWTQKNKTTRKTIVPKALVGLVVYPWNHIVSSSAPWWSGVGGWRANQGPGFNKIIESFYRK